MVGVTVNVIQLKLILHVLLSSEYQYIGLNEPAIFMTDLA